MTLCFAGVDLAGQFIGKGVDFCGFRVDAFRESP